MLGKNFLKEHKKVNAVKNSTCVRLTKGTFGNCNALLSLLVSMGTNECAFHKKIIFIKVMETEILDPKKINQWGAIPVWAVSINPLHNV